MCGLGQDNHMCFSESGNLVFAINYSKLLYVLAQSIQAICIIDRMDMHGYIIQTPTLIHTEPPHCHGVALSVLYTIST